MRLEFIKNKLTNSLLAKILPGSALCSQIISALVLFVVMTAMAGNLGYVDEGEKRRVDISLTIFPRIVAVDNNFRSKLNSENKVQLVFLYVDEKNRAVALSKSLKKKNKNIGGMEVSVREVSVDELLGAGEDEISTAIFISERLSDDDLKKVITFSQKRGRILFSPFVGDVERGVTVGISVTNRVKPYFNLATLKSSGVVINALLMKMSKRYE